MSTSDREEGGQKDEPRGADPTAAESGSESSEEGAAAEADAEEAVVDHGHP
jgi:hypothetical protein